MAMKSKPELLLTWEELFQSGQNLLAEKLCARLR